MYRKVRVADAGPLTARTCGATAAGPPPKPAMCDGGSFRVALPGATDRRRTARRRVSSADPSHPPAFGPRLTAAGGPTPSHPRLNKLEGTVTPAIRPGCYGTASLT